jgi:hypothetical protein
LSRCNCGNATCSCIITAGDGVTVVGNGSPTRPYEIASTVQHLPDILAVADSPTLDLVAVGSGTTSDKLTIYGTVTAKMSDLTDVADPDGGPATGDVPIWVAGSPSHWEFRQLPSGPPTTVQVAAGLLGDGSAGTPLKPNSFVFGAANPSGEGWPGLAKAGSDDTYGQPVYVGADAKLRAAPLVIPSAVAKNLSDAGGTYPVGMSVYALSSAQATAGTWPGAGTVVTFRRSNDTDANAICHQWWYPASGALVPLIRRFAASTWTAFATAFGDDTGWVNLTPASGTGICRYRVKAGIVYFSCGLSGVTSVASNGLGAVVAAGGIPAAYRPAVTIYSAGSAGGSGMTLGNVNTDGSVAQWNPNYNTGPITVARFAMSWPVE